MSRWRPGQSGNPGGRTKETDEMKEAIRLAREYSPQAIRRLIELCDSSDHKIAIAACNSIADRALGKPVTTADINVTRDQARELENLPAEQRIAMLEAALQAEKRVAEEASRPRLALVPSPDEIQ